MKLIKAAIVYKAEIPADVTALAAHLSEIPFTECMELQTQSVGFVQPLADGAPWVQPFPGGFAFAVRVDNKVIPASAVRCEVDKRVKITENLIGRKVGKKHRAEVKDEVMTDFCRRALVRTRAIVTCFYDIATGYLIVPTASQNIAQTCVSLLVSAVGSVKTETIHVSGAKRGLTTRLQEWLNGDDDAFGDFQPCDDAALCDAEGRKITAKMAVLSQARQGLNEAMSKGFKVTSIGFCHDGMDFRLTSDFHMKSVQFLDSDLPETGDGGSWEVDATVQVKKVSAVITELSAMLAYDGDAEGGAL